MSVKKIAATVGAIVAAVVAWKASRPRPPQPEQGTWEPATDSTTAS